MNVGKLINRLEMTIAIHAIERPIGTCPGRNANAELRNRDGTATLQAKVSPVFSKLRVFERHMQFLSSSKSK